MAMIGHPREDDELIDYILAGLGPQFSALVASLTVINALVSLTIYFAYLLYEAMLAQYTPP